MFSHLNSHIINMYHKWFLLSQNLIPTVLFKFSDSLFALNHSIISFKSCSSVYLKKLLDLWLLNKVVSSANKIILLKSGIQCKSFIKIINKSGPRQLPCAAPYIMS